MYRWGGGPPWAVASREARRPTIAPYRNRTRVWGTATGHEAKPRTAPVARRRDGDIAPYRNGTRVWGAARGNAWCARGAHGNAAGGRGGWVREGKIWVGFLERI